MESGRVDGLHRTPTKRGDLEPLIEAAVVADRGIEGDHHGRARSSRQVVLVEAEILDDLDLKPGQIREQLCVRGLGGIHAGDVLEIGTVRLEIVKPRVPCQVMDGVRPGLRRQLEGRAGWCARATVGGRVAVGDTVTVGRVDDPEWLHDFRHALATYEAAPPPAASGGADSGDADSGDGWGLREELAHLVGWNERCTERLAALAAGASHEHWDNAQRDAFNAASVARLVQPETTSSELYRLHDLSATAAVDAAREHGDRAEAWIRALAAHYREHAAE